MKGALMVCGTASDVGKTQIVTGLCRLLHRRGVSVAPFKAQNMSNNSFVTSAGGEMGRAQGIQALAAGVEPEVTMNPILLKPTGETGSQVVVNGRPVGQLSAMEYHRRKPELLGTVLEALADLRGRFDVVLAEGAGGAAEINLLDHDIVNLRVAVEARLPAVVVGDIDRGGVFAALYGTVALLPESHRRQVMGFIVNKLRGDPRLLGDVGRDLESRCGVPTLGVLPWLDDIALDAEDSVALLGPRPRPPASGPPPAGVTEVDPDATAAAHDQLDIAVVRLPRLSNFTDLDPLGLEDGVGVRMVDRPGGLGSPDLIVLPGTKATTADLAWLRTSGLLAAVARARAGGTLVLGICGGYQMLGRRIEDDVEGHVGVVDGIGWLDAETVFGTDKLTRPRRGEAWGEELRGYQIHHGRVRPQEDRSWVRLADQWGAEDEGAISPDGAVMGTTLHGLFETDGFRRRFLTELATRRGRSWRPGRPVSFTGAREAQWDRVADALEEHLDLDRLEKIITGAPRRP